MKRIIRRLRPFNVSVQGLPAIAVMLGVVAALLVAAAALVALGAALSIGFEFLGNQLAFAGRYRWAAAIVLFAVVVKTAALPLVLRQARSNRSLAPLQWELSSLRQQYRDQPDVLRAEMGKLYASKGIRPPPGCLPAFVQLPALLPLWGMIRNLGAEVDMALLGTGDLATPARATLGGLVLLALVTITAYLLKWNKPHVDVSDDDQILRALGRLTQGTPASTKGSRLFASALPAIMLVAFWMHVPAGLALYWLTLNVYQLIVQAIIYRRPVPA